MPWLHGLHLRYGPELRFGPTDVSYTAARAWQEVQGYERGQPENPKARDSFPQPTNGGLITSSPCHSHAAPTLFPAPFFSESLAHPVRSCGGRRPGYIDSGFRAPRPHASFVLAGILGARIEGAGAAVSQIVRKEVPQPPKCLPPRAASRLRADARTPRSADLLVSKLGELGAGGTPVEMTRSFNFATFDAMAELCFGHPLGLLERHEYSPWLRSLFATIQMLPFVSFVAYYPLVAAVFARLQPRWLLEQRLRHFRHSADRVDQRLREGGAGKPDVWNLVEAAQQSEAKLSRDEMYSNAATFMVAGSETTGSRRARAPPFPAR